MANYERDKDDVRAFDGGEDDDSEGSHLPVVIIIAILVLAAFGGVVWLAYNQGVARGRSDVPVQVASAGKANPANGIKVYQEPAGAEDEEENVQTAPATPELPRAETAQAEPAPAATTAPVKPEPETMAAPQPAPAATKPPAQLGVAQPAPQKPAVVAKPAESKPVAAALKPAETKPAAAGSYLLQIGAYKSEAEAMAAWRTYQSKHATLLKGFGPDVQRADLGAKGVFYRLRVSSFSDRTAAVALCERLKADNGACFLAR